MNFINHEFYIALGLITFMRERSEGICSQSFNLYFANNYKILKS